MTAPKMPEPTKPVLPVGDRFQNAMFFRQIGSGQGQTLYECWGDAIDAYAERCIQYGREQMREELQAMERKSPPDLESIIDYFVEDYEMIGETEDGCDACHTPTEDERALIKDAICGLLADTDWENAWGAHIQSLAMERKPIKTAPKDGTNVLLYFSGLGWVRGSWDSQKNHKTPRPYWTHDCISYLGVARARANQPAWWQPLPAAPDGINGE